MCNLNERCYMAIIYPVHKDSNGKCVTCTTCFYSDSWTTYCHKHNKGNTIEDYCSGCADHVDIGKALSEFKCPHCGSANIVFNDTDELSEQVFITCSDCNHYVVDDNRHDAIKRWMTVCSSD